MFQQNTQLYSVRVHCALQNRSGQIPINFEMLSNILEVLVVVPPEIYWPDIRTLYVWIIFRRLEGFYYSDFFYSIHKKKLYMNHLHFFGCKMLAYYLLFWIPKGLRFLHNFTYSNLVEYSLKLITNSICFNIYLRVKRRNDF